MRHTKPILSLLVMLLLSGCASGQLAGWLPATDPRIDQAPMRADTKSEARKYFNKPNPKAFAFSPEKGTYWAQWGSPTLTGAKELAMRKCEETTRTTCLLFAVNNEIVWQPTAEHPGALAPEDKLRATSVASEPVALAPQAADPVSDPAAAPEVPPPAARARPRASVRHPAEYRRSGSALHNDIGFSLTLSRRLPGRWRCRAKVISTASSVQRSPRRRLCVRGFAPQRDTAR